MKPSVKHLRIFGCVAYMHVPDATRKKLDDKSIKCVFLGVSEESKAYMLYDLVTRKIMVSKDVVFTEQETWDWKVTKGDKGTECDIDGNDNSEHQQEDTPVSAAEQVDGQNLSTPQAHSSGRTQNKRIIFNQRQMSRLQKEKMEEE